MNFPQKIYLSIGTNMGDRLAQIQTCLEALQARGILVHRTASIYETTPWQFDGAPTFYNTVFECETQINAHELLCLAQGVEIEMGRQKKSSEKYESRVIDIDILFYEKQVITSIELTIPHPFLHQRNFVLTPLKELIPSVYHPLIHQTISELLDCSNDKETAFIVSPPLFVN